MSTVESGRDRAICPSCGAAWQPNVDALLRLSTRRPDDIERLLYGHFDSIRCDACGAGGFGQPTIEILGEGWSDTGLPETVRHSVAERFRKHIEGFIADILGQEDRDSQVSLAQQRWKEMTAEVIAAAMLHARGATSQSILPTWPASGDTGVPTVLGVAQAVAFHQLSANVSESDSVSLEESLDRFIAPELVTQEAAEALGAFIERGPWQHLHPSDRYIVSAVHASACTAIGCPNPHAQRWAAEYFTFAWALADDTDNPEMTRLKISKERARNTLDPTSLWQLAQGLVVLDASRLERVQVLLTECGYPSLLRDMVEAISIGADIDGSTMVEALRRIHETDPSLASLLGVLGLQMRSLVASGRTGDLGPLADQALTLTDGSDISRASVLAQLGAALKDARRPQEFVDRVGAQPAQWEHGLPIPVRLALWTERANALRLVGERLLARSILEELVTYDLDSDNRWVVDLNFAISLRETGEPDRAERMMDDLLGRSPNETRRFEALQALLSTVSFLGNHEKSIAVAAQARELARGKWASEAPRLTSQLAMLQAIEGRHQDALTTLAELPPGAEDPRTTISVGSTVVALLERANGAVDDGLIQRTQERLRIVARAQHDAGDQLVERSALQVLALMEDLLGTSEGELWQELVDGSGEWSGRPLALVSLATHRYRQQRNDEARDLLSRVPAALANALGAGSDLGAMLDTTGRLKRAMRHLATIALESGPFDAGDAVLIAELQRDGLARARVLRASSSTSTTMSIPGRSISHLVPDGGRLYVLEWLGADQGIGPLLTQVSDSGDLRVRPLPPIGVTIREVARHMRARLNGCRPGRLTDPFDFAPWRQVEDWLVRSLSDVGPSDHVVIVDHEQTAGIPWHAASEIAATMSYAAGWSALAELAEHEPQPPRTVGVLSVPALSESLVSGNAFSASLLRTERWATAGGFNFRSAIGDEADRHALIELLQSCDLLKLQCHGLVVPIGQDLTLMVAANGILPSQHVNAAWSQRLAAHRVSWRDLQVVTRGPRLVCSAACSTGTSLIGGHGDRLGLFAALRDKGTVSVLAPAWDGVTLDVLQQTDEILELHVGGMPLAQAVKEISEHFAKTLPRWRSHALAIEGDWR